MKKTLARARLNYDELVTVVTEIESVINSRPLTYVYNDHNEPEPMTPNQILTGKNICKPVTVIKK